MQAYNKKGVVLTPIISFMKLCTRIIIKRLRKIYCWNILDIQSKPIFHKKAAWQEWGSYIWKHGVYLTMQSGKTVPIGSLKSSLIP